jgi:hypothetical protein
MGKQNQIKKKGRQLVEDILNLTSNYSDEGMVDWKQPRNQPEKIEEKIVESVKKITPRIK